VRDNDGVSAPSTPVGPTFYRLATPVAARFLGAAIIVLAIVVFLVTAVVFATGADDGWILLPLVVGVVAVLALGWWLRTKAYVVRCTAQGYSIRFVRGAGVREARWADVQEAVTASPRGIPLLVLRLKNGTTTSIPVTILAIDREQFVREMQRHLSSGIRPLGR
jgi:hypothetical protein